MMNSQKVKKSHMFVIPRSGRGQEFQILTSSWIPAFAGMTTFLRLYKV